MKANCVICGAEFDQRNSQEKTCGPECRRRNMLKNNAAFQQRRRAALRHPSKCVVCGVEFKSIQFRKTCGVDCAMRRNQERMRDWRNRPENAEKIRQHSRRHDETLKAERAARRVIEPVAEFPAHIDRDAFGHWLSGFTDGEGCFFLQAQIQERSKNFLCTARFAIALRDDDVDILRLVQSFWGCGRLSAPLQPARFPRSGNPSVTFVVSSVRDLAGVIVPHFDSYPLMAKKRRDYAVWKEGVLLCAAVNERPRTWQKGVRGSRSRWREDERREFLSLAESLRAGRRYSPVEAGRTAPEPEDPGATPPLFARTPQAPADLSPARYSCIAEPKS